MLNAHEQIINHGESDFIFGYIRKRPEADDWVCDLDLLRQDRIFQAAQNLSILSSSDGRQIALHFVDQLQKRAPNCYLCLVLHGNADKVAALFPDCRVIHLVRDPRDVANSCIGMGWAGNTYFGIDLWSETESNWESARKFFKESNILELKFEDLIARPQANLQRVCSFLNVSFSPAMLNYSASSTYAPPDPMAIEQWRRELDPRAIALVEVKTRALLLDRGYKLSGYPLRPPGHLEKSTLAWNNKLYKWKFAYRRYGLVTFVMEKLTRKVAKSLHPMFVNRMTKVERRHLK